MQGSYRTSDNSDAGNQEVTAHSGLILGLDFRLGFSLGIVAVILHTFFQCANALAQTLA